MNSILKPTDPKHYTQFKPQPLLLFDQMQLPFAYANVLKYTLRAPWKNGLEDVQKAFRSIELIREFKLAPPPDGICFLEILDQFLADNSFLHRWQKDAVRTFGLYMHTLDPIHLMTANAFLNMGIVTVNDWYQKDNPDAVKHETLTTKT